MKLLDKFTNPIVRMFRKVEYKNFLRAFITQGFPMFITAPLLAWCEIKGKTIFINEGPEAFMKAISKEIDRMEAIAVNVVGGDGMKVVDKYLEKRGIEKISPWFKDFLETNSDGDFKQGDRVWYSGEKVTLICPATFVRKINADKSVVMSYSGEYAEVSNDYVNPRKYDPTPEEKAVYVAYCKKLRDEADQKKNAQASNEIGNLAHSEVAEKSEAVA